MNEFQTMVQEFMKKFGQTVGATPAIRDPRLREALVAEEAGELMVAFARCDIVGVADAVADLLYVTIGTAVACGIDIDPIFREVHASNMRKVGGGTSDAGKVLKPNGWQKPRIEQLLLEQIRKRPNVAPSVPYFCHECLEGGPHPNVLHSDPDGQCLAWNPSDGRRCACAASLDPARIEIVAACTPLTTVVIEEVIAENLGWDGDCGPIETFVPTVANTNAELTAQIAELQGQVKIAREGYNHLIVKNLELEAVLDKLEGWRAP